MNNNIVLSCQNLTKSFIDGDRTIDVLGGIDFQISRGETVAILGESGSGKSTLLHILGGLDAPSQGQVSWNGEDIANLSETKRCEFRNHQLGFVYQFHHLLPEFSALENVAMPLIIRGVTKSAALEKAKELLKKVGLEERVEHRPNQLSGGERQRVAIARALVTEPKCVLADEPTGNLDAATAEQMLKLILSLQSSFGISFVIVTHSQHLASKLQKQYVLRNGRLCYPE